MGLKPTGRLKLGDFRDIAEAREKTVSSKLTATMEYLGIDEDQKISISLDGEHNLTIAESFPGKSKLLEALKLDPEFELAFKQLSANKQILDFTSDLTTQSKTLANFIDDNSDWDHILSTAKKYKEIRFRDNSLVSLLGVSKLEFPYTYVLD